MGALAPDDEPRPAAGTAPTLFSGRLKRLATVVTPLLKRRCDRRNADTLADLRAIMRSKSATACL
jgi:hypothetical protein